MSFAYYYAVEIRKYFTIFSRKIKLKYKSQVWGKKHTWIFTFFSWHSKWPLSTSIKWYKIYDISTRICGSASTFFWYSIFHVASCIYDITTIVWMTGKGCRKMSSCIHNWARNSGGHYGRQFYYIFFIFFSATEFSTKEKLVNTFTPLVIKYFYRCLLLIFALLPNQMFDTITKWFR